MKQDDMEKEKKKCSGTYLEDSHPDIYPESVKEETRRIYNRGLSETSGR